VSAWKVKTTGLKELRRDLKRLEPEGEWKPEMRAAGLASAQVVADEARRRLSQGATTKSGKHATGGSVLIGSVRAQASQRGASVALGQGPSRAYAAQWNFGGRARQFPGPKAPDYGLYTALSTKGEEVARVYRDQIDGLLKRHGL